MAAVMQFQVSVSRRAIKHRPLGGGDSIASHLGSSGGHHSAGQAARLQQCLRVWDTSGSHAGGSFRAIRHPGNAKMLATAVRMFLGRSPGLCQPSVTVHVVHDVGKVPAGSDTRRGIPRVCSRPNVSRRPPSTPALTTYDLGH